jgi:hypothetical protein
MFYELGFAAIGLGIIFTVAKFLTDFLWKGEETGTTVGLSFVFMNMGFFLFLLASTIFGTGFNSYSQLLTLSINATTANMIAVLQSNNTQLITYNEIIFVILLIVIFLYDLMFIRAFMLTRMASEKERKHLTK